jgi:hypothetical protein
MNFIRALTFFSRCIQKALLLLFSYLRFNCSGSSTKVQNQFHIHIQTCTYTSISFSLSQRMGKNSHHSISNREFFPLSLSHHIHSELCQFEKWSGKKSSTMMGDIHIKTGGLNKKMLNVKTAFLWSTFREWEANWGAERGVTEIGLRWIRQWQ